MTTVLPPAPPAPRKSHWGCFAVIVGIIVIAFALFVALLAWIYFYGPLKADIPEAPDDTGLPLERHLPPEADNALSLLVRGAEALTWSDTDRDHLQGKLDREGWSEALLPLIDVNDEAAKRLERAMETCAAVAAQPTPDDDPAIMEMEALDNLVLYVDLDVARRFAENGATAAIGRALSWMELARRVQGAGISFLSYTMVGEVANHAMDRFQEVLPLATLDKDAEATIKRRLNALLADDSMTSVVKTEYELACNGMESIMAAWKNTVQGGAVDSGNQAPPRQVPPMAMRMLRPNEARVRIVDHFRALLAELDKPLAEISFPARENPDSMGIREIIQVNILWEMVRDAYIPQEDDIFVAKSLARTRLQIARTAVALQAYRSRNETLPESLDELVPDYLPEIPMDDLDGVPIRYDVDEQRLWVSPQRLDPRFEATIGVLEWSLDITETEPYSAPSSHNGE